MVNQPMEGQRVHPQALHLLISREGKASWTGDISMCPMTCFNTTSLDWKPTRSLVESSICSITIRARPIRTAQTLLSVPVASMKKPGRNIVSHSQKRISYSSIWLHMSGHAKQYAEINLGNNMHNSMYNMQNNMHFSHATRMNISLSAYTISKNNGLPGHVVLFLFFQ